MQSLLFKKPPSKSPSHFLPKVPQNVPQNVPLAVNGSISNKMKSAVSVSPPVAALHESKGGVDATVTNAHADTSEGGQRQLESGGKGGNVTLRTRGRRAAAMAPNVTSSIPLSQGQKKSAEGSDNDHRVSEGVDNDHNRVSEGPKKKRSRSGVPVAEVVVSTDDIDTGSNQPPHKVIRAEAETGPGPGPSLRAKRSVPLKPVTEPSAASASAAAAVPGRGSSKSAPKSVAAVAPQMKPSPKKRPRGTRKKANSGASGTGASGADE